MHSGRQGIDGDIVGLEFQSETWGQSFYAEFRSAVGNSSCDALFTGASRDIDDAPAGAASSQRQAFLDAQKRSAQIDIDSRIPILECETHSRSMIAGPI